MPIGMSIFQFEHGETSAKTPTSAIPVSAKKRFFIAFTINVSALFVKERLTAAWGCNYNERYQTNGFHSFQLIYKALHTGGKSHG
jgi:hypothetical protein